MNASISESERGCVFEIGKLEVENNHEFLARHTRSFPEKDQISGQIYRRPSSNLKYLQKTLIKSTIFTEKPHQIYNIYRRPSSQASGVISHQLDCMDI